MIILYNCREWLQFENVVCLKEVKLEKWGKLLKIVLVAIVTAVIDYVINEKDSVFLSFRK